VKAGSVTQALINSKICYGYTNNIASSIVNEWRRSLKVPKIWENQEAIN